MPIKDRRTVNDWHASIVLPQLFWKTGLKYAKIFLWKRRLTDDIPPIKTEIPVKIRLASIHDLKRSRLLKGEAAKRVNKGDLGFIAIWNGMTVGYLWASLQKKVHIKEVEREISLNTGEVYLYDGFVLLSFRRKGLFKKLLEEALRYFKSRNMEKIIAGSLTNNKASEKAFKALGFRPFRLLKLVKIFRFKKFEEHELKSYERI